MNSNQAREVMDIADALSRIAAESGSYNLMNLSEAIARVAATEGEEE